ncbi:hypothetical protein A1O1_03810 [Capronia coronata CBS 617.96]|uniref:Uncharacterized protein n=1 Tax=Capronia coronata CBS 617.96 TaxID=1182541 RepID=W9YN86_9EURO|nr:uncharacterized protein A1O1_03810 [Capronia coronata CBS 617.96]EXJ90706.1 hypothetical protein A1O1_03810 [Capronia coronata CBS 617.96]
MPSFAKAVFLLQLLFYLGETAQVRRSKSESIQDDHGEPFATHRHNGQYENNDRRFFLTSSTPAYSTEAPNTSLISSIYTAQRTTIPESSSPAEQSGNPNSTVRLQRRQCVWDIHTFQWDCDHRLPSLYDLVDRYHDSLDGGRATAQNSVWFYNNMPVATVAERDYTAGLILGMLAASGVSGYSIFDGVNTYWRLAQDQHILENADQVRAANPALRPTDDPITILHLCYCQAAAVAAVNPDAYVFMPGGTIWRPESVWATTEFPALTRNPNIMRIWRVDPRPESPLCGFRDLIWSRDHGDPPWALGYLCPLLSPSP